MLLELLLERLKAALRVKGNWAVYAAYDPAPFAKREESFLTVGITALETEQAFSDETYWYFPFSAAAQVRLLTAPETDAQVLYDRYWQTVVSGMLSAGCTVQKIRTGTPTEWKQFRKIALEGQLYPLRCLSNCQRGGACTMNGTFQVVSPREFPVRLGDLTFYAAGWKLSGTRQYAQQGGVQESRLCDQYQLPCQTVDAGRQILLRRQPRRGGSGVGFRHTGTDTVRL